MYTINRVVSSKKYKWIKKIINYSTILYVEYNYSKFDFLKGLPCCYHINVNSSTTEHYPEILGWVAQSFGWVTESKKYKYYYFILSLIRHFRKDSLCFNIVKDEDGSEVAWACRVSEVCRVEVLRTTFSEGTETSKVEFPTSNGTNVPTCSYRLVEPVNISQPSPVNKHPCQWWSLVI